MIGGPATFDASWQSSRLEQLLPVVFAPDSGVQGLDRPFRMELTGEAFTFASPEETDDLRSIERAIGKPLPRVTLPDFDYSAKPTGKLEVPIAERIAKIRAQRAEERARGRDKEARRTSRGGRSNGGRNR